MSAVAPKSSLGASGAPFTVTKLDHRLDLLDKAGVKPATTGKSGRLRGSYGNVTMVDEPPQDWAYFLAANYGAGRYKVTTARGGSWKFTVDEEMAQRARAMADRIAKDGNWQGGLFFAAPLGRAANPSPWAANAVAQAPRVEDARGVVQSLRDEMRAMFAELRDELVGEDDEDDDDEGKAPNPPRAQNPVDTLKGALDIVAEAKAAFGDAQEKPTFDWSVVVDGFMKAIGSNHIGAQLGAAAQAAQGQLPLAAANPAAPAAVAPTTPNAEKWGYIVSALERAGISPEVAADMVLPHLPEYAAHASPAVAPSAP